MLRSKKIYVAFFLISLFVLFLLYRLSSQDQKLNNAELIRDESTFEDVVSEDTPKQTETQIAAEEVLLAVHIMGAVEKPGVYYMPEDSIINDLIQKAGGLKTEADLLFINLAEELLPNQKIYIPIEGEYEFNTEDYLDLFTHVNQDSNSEISNVKINLNQADSSELQKLNGIGPSKAEDIINYRNEYGKFHSIEDVMNVPGIKENTFAKFKEQVIVD